MASKYVLAAGTNLEMSKEVVKDTSGKTAAEPAAPVTMVSLDCTTKQISYTGITTDEIDVTTLCSGGFKENALGLSDPGEFFFTGHYVQKAESQKEIAKAAKDKLMRLFRVTFPDGSKFEICGFVKARKWDASNVGDVITAEVTIRCSGEPVETAGA